MADLTDQQITEACAMAKGDVFAVVPPIWSDEGLWCFPDGAPDSDGFWYQPLQDDAQAMALLKKLRMELWWDGDDCIAERAQGRIAVRNRDPLRAICLCAALAAKESGRG